MTDAQLGQALMEANRIEREVRQERRAVPNGEREAAEMVLRQAVALRKVLERWITTRACLAPARST